MKKNKQWLRDRYESMETIKATTKNSRGKRSTSYLKKKTVINLLNQLDEPETLSEEWIERNTSPVDDEGRLYIWKRDLQNLLVPKQELPVIPKFVAEYIDDRKEVSFPLYQAIRIVRENSRFEHSHLREWLWTNKGQETFARAWLDGFTIANEDEEQRYYVEDGKHALLCKWESLDGWKVISTTESTEDDLPIEVLDYGLTEQEIKDYDERYMNFAVKVEEMEE